MKRNDVAVNVIGAGLAGMSASLELASAGYKVRLFSVQASERAQSNLAEGGINAALDLMGEDDTTAQHYGDTMRGGCYLADPNMVKNLTDNAPDVVLSLGSLGVPFQREGGHILQRNFGGQKKKRTAFVKSTTGKALTSALIDRIRFYEGTGLIDRLPHHRFEKLIIEDEKLVGVVIRDLYTDKSYVSYGITIIACGGMNGLFFGHTTGTTANTGSCQASLFASGLKFANLEFIQYHPTTVAINDKRMLISEAARGEGGRLFYYREDGEKCYFLEEMYGKDGNLMPRDVISRTMAQLDTDVYLDMTHLSQEIWDNKLLDLREEIIHYKSIDPATEPIQVSFGIHYFMGGIAVDENHHTSISGLYAAGECAAAYHGANRLGGNSLLGAIYGGRRAARSLMDDIAKNHKLYESSDEITSEEPTSKELISEEPASEEITSQAGIVLEECKSDYTFTREDEEVIERELEDILYDTLSVLRSGPSLENGLKRLMSIPKSGASDELIARLLLGEAMIRSAINRKESRGAHTRTDYPDTQGSYHKTTIARLEGARVNISLEDIPTLRGETL